MDGVSRHRMDADIYDSKGRRKYLTGDERKRFRLCAETLPASDRNFCLMLYYTGARISEALELTAERLDLNAGVVIIRTLKRRSHNVFRAIPLPKAYLMDLLKMMTGEPQQAPLWPFSRKTGYRIIKNVMTDCRITGTHACPKGLRHGFGIACVEQNIPLPTIAKWMGHSSITTTAIYLNAVGKEERKFAERLW